jgi:hypothetical protein
MKMHVKTILRVLLIASLLSCRYSESMVYVCNSKGSVAFHQSKNCKGLQQCTHEIIYITEKEAVDKYRKRACKMCH